MYSAETGLMTPSEVATATGVSARAVGGVNAARAMNRTAPSGWTMDRRGWLARLRPVDSMRKLRYFLSFANNARGRTTGSIRPRDDPVQESSEGTRM